MKKNYLLILILLVAAAIRLVGLDVYPAGFNADEAALGYNAYSLLQTGRDEHGHVMPVNLESFADYKPALYSYLLVPIIKVFGLTESVVRFPSALFGILAVLYLWISIRFLFPQHRLLADVSAVYLAFLPWHIHFSRGAWEVNVASTLILVAFISLYRFRQVTHLPWLTRGMALLVLSMYTYQSARIIAPLLGLGFFLTNLRLFWGERQHLPKSILVLCLTLIPLGLSLIFSNASSRLSGVGLLADEGPLNFVKEMRGQHSGADSLIGKVLHNRPVIYSLQFIKNYLSHFEGNFLFVNGDIIDRNRIPETGLLFFLDLFFVVIGLFFLVRNFSGQSRLLLLWAGIAPIASALTFQSPHALRAHNLLFPLGIFAASGWFVCFKFANSQKNIYRSIVLSLLLITFSWQTTRSLHEYFIHYPQALPVSWQFGFKEIASYVKSNEDRYQKVIITDKYDQPYILLLFYLRFDPSAFQSNHVLTARDQYNFSTVRAFSKYEFTNTNWDNVRDIHSSLIIATAADIPDVGVNVVKTINFPGGQPGFKIISN